jgi:hypothetical protein
MGFLRLPSYISFDVFLKINCNKLQVPKHPPNKRTIGAQKLCLLSDISGAVPEAGQLAAALLFDQLQGRREGDTTLSSANHCKTI